MGPLQILCVALVLCSVAILSPVQGLAVMSVDFGSEWMKVAIVSVLFLLINLYFSY